jgi:hypothetical protein
MKTYPLRQWSLTDAQFRLVALFQRAFNGFEALEAGDYGAAYDLARSRATAEVECVLAEFFETEDAVLVPGAGTGAIRNALMASLSPGARVVVHDAPVYATTGVTFRAMGIDALPRDFNDRRQLADGLGTKPAMVYVQHSRQRLDDRYDLAEVIDRVRQVSPQSLVLVDDNYTAFQVPRIGTQLGANLSGFSLFKVLGEPGVGCVLGDARLIGWSSGNRSPARSPNAPGGGAPRPTLSARSRSTRPASWCTGSPGRCARRTRSAQRILRVNPLRAGPDTVLRVLAEAVTAVRQLDDFSEGAAR